MHLPALKVIRSIPCFCLHSVETAVAETTASEVTSTKLVRNVSLEQRTPDLSLVPESGSVLTSAELGLAQTAPLSGEVPKNLPSIYSDISQQKGLHEVTEEISSEPSTIEDIAIAKPFGSY